MKSIDRIGAGLFRGIGGSLPLALLPSVLSNHLSKPTFSVWVLVVQVGIYVAYLEAGVQLAVTRSVVLAVVAREKVDDTISAGIGLTCILVVASLPILAGAAFFVPALFSVESSLLGTARVSVAIFSACVGFGLPSSTLNGALIGEGHHWAAALGSVGVRLVSVVATGVLGLRGAPLPLLALTLGLGYLASWPIADVLVRSRCGISVRYRKVPRSVYDELRKVMATAGTWNFAMLLISGVDLLVVGFVDYPHIAAYSLAAGLLNLFATGFGLVNSALLPVYVSNAAKGHSHSERFLLKTVSLGTFALCCAALVGVGTHGLVLRFWANRYAAESTSVFLLLLAANTIRLALAPLSSVFLSGENHARTRFPALFEAGINILASIALGLIFGYRGVAAGTLAGSLAAGVCYLVIAGKLLPSRLRRRVLWTGLLLPLLLSFTFGYVLLAAESFGVRCFAFVLGATLIFALTVKNIVFQEQNR